jgi:hypothetical protein
VECSLAHSPFRWKPGETSFFILRLFCVFARFLCFCLCFRLFPLFASPTSGEVEPEESAHRPNYLQCFTVACRVRFGFGFCCPILSIVFLSLFRETKERCHTLAMSASRKKARSSKAVSKEINASAVVATASDIADEPPFTVRVLPYFPSV